MLYLLYAFLVGAASAFAFEPAALWPLLLIAFAFLCEFTCRSKTLWRALLVGWAFGVGQFVIGLNWIATAFTYQSNMPAWLGWVAVVLLSLYLALYPALATGLAWRFSRDNRVAQVVVLGGAWAITEWLRGAMFTGFPWNPAAAALAPTPLITITPLIGTYGLSGLVVLLGGAVWLEYYKKWLPLVVIVAATALLWILPSSPVPPDPLAVMNVRVVQPNIGQQDKWRPEFAEEAARRLAALSMAPGDLHPRLLLWPEAAVTEPLQDDRRSGPAADFAAFERARAAAPVQPGEFLLTGGIALQSKDGFTISGATNSVFILAPGGKLVGRYDKAHLTPYGEYLPMRPLLSAIGLSRLAPGDTDFTPGPGPRTVSLPGWGKVGLQICYEIIFSGEVVDEKNRPAFIFNPSNDAWFGRWGPPQHLAQARLRAAEEGLPVLRSTPTGVSAVIDGRGHVVKSLPWRTAGVIDVVLPPAAKSPPLFARFGNIIPLLLGFALIIGGIVLGRRRR
jgi:apolipoprotein N-acyltransferase